MLNSSAVNIDVADDEFVDQVLELLQLNRAKKRLKAFLESMNVEHRGKWTDLFESVHEAVRSELITREQLIDILDEVEEYGKQHIYLFECAGPLISRLKDRAFVEAALLEMGYPSLLGKSYPINKPVQPTLASARLTGSDLVLKWVERKVSYILIGQREVPQQDGRIILNKQYEKKISRQTIILHVHLNSRQVELKVKIAPIGGKKYYLDKLNEYTIKLSPLIDLQSALPVSLAPAIKPIMDASGTVLHRGAKIRTVEGATVGITSAAQNESYKDSDFYRGGEERTQKKFEGIYVNVYWQPGAPNSPLTEEVHTHIFNTNEIIFPTTTSPKAMEYVLQKVRAFARTTA